MRPLQGFRILVVEDDWLIASDLRRIIEDAGGVVTAFISRLAEMDFCAGDESDAALLNVRLADGLADPIARQLQNRRIPFIVVTGYEREMLPPSLREAPYMQKPILGEDLVAAVERCEQAAALEAAVNRR